METHPTGLLFYSVDKVWSTGKAKELFYTSFLTQDWVKPALIYLTNI